MQKTIITLFAGIGIIGCNGNGNPCLDDENPQGECHLDDNTGIDTIDTGDSDSDNPSITTTESQTSGTGSGSGSGDHSGSTQTDTDSMDVTYSVDDTDNDSGTVVA